MLRQKTIFGLFGAAIMLLGVMVPLLSSHGVSADQITTRSLTLEGVGAIGGSQPGGTVNHLFQFSLPSTTALGSIKFQYCTTAAAVTGGIDCDLPTNIDTTGATLGTQTGVMGFSSTTASTNGTVIISRTSASTISAGAVSYELDGIKNPSDAETFFVRISTYGSLDASGSPIDTGTVAAATSTQVVLTGTMPESLVFCAGAVVGETNSVPDCSTVTTGAVDFNKLFSPTDTAAATSQMAASTNAGSGYAITVNGPTLTSGSNTINAMTTTDTSKHGVSQFGMNLVLDDGSAYTNAPDLTTMPAGMAPSADVIPTTNGTNYNATVASGYDAAGTHNGTYTFNGGDIVATSNSKGTDSQIYTASYIVNVPGSQPAGTYATTLTYICTPTF